MKKLRKLPMFLVAFVFCTFREGGGGHKVLKFTVRLIWETIRLFRKNGPVHYSLKFGWWLFWTIIDRVIGPLTLAAAIIAGLGLVLVAVMVFLAILAAFCGLELFTKGCKSKVGFSFKLNFS